MIDGLLDSCFTSVSFLPYSLSGNDPHAVYNLSVE